MKKVIKIVSVILVILVISGFFIIKNLTETKDGKLNMYVAANLQLYKILNLKSINSKSIEEIRGNLNKQSTKWSNKPILFSNIKNLDIKMNNEKIPVRIYTPENGSNFPIIIYSHGGFWIGGNTDTSDRVCRKLSQNTKAIVISVNYRLAPENPFPAGLNDVYNVLQWTYKNAKSINGDEKHIAVIGDSAGGNLSAAVSSMSRDKNGPPITCQVLIYPSTNIFELNSKSWSYFSNSVNVSREDMEKYISIYVPKKEDRKNPYASPLLSKDFSKLPDTLVVTAEIDPLRDEGEAYANKLKESGVKVDVARYKGITHGFITMDKITNKADEALNQISLYIQKEFQK
ncbi:esterase [Clostridium botulinum A2 117]|uniref:alpha/beta hydrolase n=1 Tax=Clostridium botulinum TaxID=1491 RepID=UPI0007734ADD|nr:alpha/beta hydrolase [Clostridium botulinum]KEI78989.1 esterase [Clostridium botulinum A2 117]MBY6806555.1 alpha/beta hydrolase [Clostridium botulinum]MCS4476645.1 alpha/beta hydrolase [Clostridium botulinum]